jgi:hypothetical protein
MYRFISLFCSIVLIVSLAACSQDKPKEQASTPQATQQQPDLGTAAAPPAAAVTGKVLETIDSAGYTYLNVESDAGTKWIAVNQTSVAVGEEVTYLDGMVMQNFVSKTLDRTFPEIVFSGGLVGKGATPPAMTPPGAGAESFSQALSSEGAPAAGDAGMITGSQKAVVPSADVKVEKAAGENSYSVGEIFSKGAELNGQAVVVRGKVMKVSPRIMGRNWIHLQDGTGNPADNTHDLVVTTELEPDPAWDIITMEGVLAANKDFGSGYTYAVIIEDANLKE